MATTTKCDIIRDLAKMKGCGGCSSKACATADNCLAGQTCSGGACIGRPTACPAGVSSVVCRIPGAANMRMKAFADKYSLRPLVMSAADRQQRALEDSIYAAAIADAETNLAAAYPNAEPGATSVSWPDVGACLQDPSGKAAGPNHHVYFERDDMYSFGMSPGHPLGGNLATGAVWAAPRVSPLPASVDYVMNPDLAAIVIFVFLVLLFVALVFAWRSGRAAAPPAGPRIDAATQQECLAYVEAQEARGFPMRYYREKCGLPTK